MYRTMIVSMLAWAACSGRAADYYVNATTGDDGRTGLCAVWDGGVCGPKKTIAAGIAAASDGDSVIVAPGTYTGNGNRDLSYGGKAITVRGTNPDDPAVVAATVIDCQGSSAARHRGFVFNTGEGQGSILAGLTVRNGFAPNYTMINPYLTFSAGGAVLCSGANPSIESCVFETSRATYGGALLLDATSGVTIRKCIFRANAICGHCVGNLGLYPGGGGVAVHHSKATLERCIIDQNTVSLGSGLPFADQGYGVGCYIEDSEVLMLECSISHNRVEAGPAPSKSNGAGIYMWNSKCIFTSSDINGNGVADDITHPQNARGGAVLFESDGIFPSRLLIERCKIQGNLTAGSTGGTLAFVITEQAPIEIRDSLISDNTASSAPVVRVEAGAGHISFSGCTVAGNLDLNGGPMVMLNGADVSLSVSNSVFWNSGDELSVGSDTSVEFSNIRNGWPGTGNIDADPMFVDAANGDYHLAAGSPCIDTGDPAYAAPADEFDIDGQVRVWGGRVDMGADEHASFGAGDLNCDGSLNQFDIYGFWIALSDRDAYPGRFPNCSIDLADMNYDGSLNQFDIAGFVHALTH